MPDTDPLAITTIDDCGAGVVQLTLNDELNAALEAICAVDGRGKAEVVIEILGQHLRTNQLARALQDPELIELYQRLAEEDSALAEEGIAEFQRSLEAADRV